MSAKPISKSIASPFSASDAKNNLFLVIHAGIDTEAIQDKKSLHQRMTSPFISVNKRMVLDKRETKRSRLLSQRWIQFLATKSRTRLSQRRFKPAQITNAHRSAKSLHDLPV